MSADRSRNGAQCIPPVAGKGDRPECGEVVHEESLILCGKDAGPLINHRSMSRVQMGRDPQRSCFALSTRHRVYKDIPYTFFRARDMTSWQVSRKTAVVFVSRRKEVDMFDMFFRYSRDGTPPSL